MRLNPTSKQLFSNLYAYMEEHNEKLDTAQINLQLYVSKLEEQIRKLKKNLKETKLYIRKYPI